MTIGSAWFGHALRAAIAAAVLGTWVGAGDAAAVSPSAGAANSRAYPLVPGEENRPARGTDTPAETDRAEDLTLPEILSDADAALYREIFRAQERGRWKTADKLAAKLADRRLMGHVLAQRYLHPTAYRSRYKELVRWLDKYADHPEAKRIYKLAVKRRPKNYRWPNKPRSHRSVYSLPIKATTPKYRSSKRLSRADRRRAARLMRQIRRNVRRTRLTVSEQALASRDARRLLDQVQIDEAYGNVAAGWYYYGKLDKALALAGPASERSGSNVPHTNWIAGLAAWRLGRINQAVEHFERLAQSRYADEWNVTAGAYWAARAHLRLRQPEEVSHWLRLAAMSQRTFYGLIARRALGIETRFDYSPHQISPAGLNALLTTPESRRGLALLQAGQRDLAASEFLRLRTWTEPEATEALLAVAERGRMPVVSIKLAYRLADADHGPLEEDKLEAALYPIPPWEPDGGFRVDRALVYALMRQESQFNPRAKSRDGARGLMQLMPATAGYIARTRFRGRKRNKLFDPGLNIDLAQRYIAYLLSENAVQGNLFRLATAYNGGPGNLNKWQRRLKRDDDPLIFVESLPSKETRLFIERVLTNYWIYRARLGQDAPSLDAVASGDWPIYSAQDRATREIAHHEPN